MDMVEKVARAILKRRFYDCEPDAYGHDLEAFYASLDDDHIFDAHDESRAAIEAMREPTEAMIEDGVLAYNLTGIAGGIINTAEDHVAFIFSAMLPGTPAALNTKGGE